MQQTWRNSLLEQQAVQRDAHRWRTRVKIDSPQQAHIKVGGRQLLNFASNDYLGLANHPRLIQASACAGQTWGVGAGASHLVCGHQSLHDELEQGLAKFVGAQRALLFSTGYMANLAICTAFTNKHDLILQDKLNHASLIDGAALSSSASRRYAHLDLHHAEQILNAEQYDKSLIITDGVFSMDGDSAPLAQLKTLADAHNGLLVVDDAHGFGVMGQNGAGSLAAAGLAPSDNVLLMGTLGKACGSFGAFVAGDDVYIEQLIQSARSYIYTTALPAPVVAASLEAVQLIKEQGSERISHLRCLIEQFRESTIELDLESQGSSTPIQPLIVGSEAAALAWNEALLERGFYVSAIRPPTVPKGSARLRVTLSAAHTREHVAQLADALAQTQRELPYG